MAAFFLYQYKSNVLKNITGYVTILRNYKNFKNLIVAIKSPKGWHERILERMRRLSFILSIVLFIASVQTTGAFADDYITNAANALQNSSVYIDPSSKYSDPEYLSKLKTALKPGDNIVLVMLPEEALSGTDLRTLAQTLSEKLGNQRIIGLAVGEELIGYAPMLDVSVASDQMKRAKNVSNDPVTALITYTQNIHYWVAIYPLPTATPQPTAIPKPKVVQQDGHNQVNRIILLLLIMASGFIALGSLLLMNSNKKPVAKMSSEKRQYLNNAMDAVRSIEQYNRVISENGATLTVQRILAEIYLTSMQEIIKEIEEEPSRATTLTVQRFSLDITEFAEVLRIYSQIMSKRVRQSAVSPGFKEHLESNFFPKVRYAIKQIADELDKGDVQKLEDLVRSLSNEFQSRGY